VYKNKIRLIFGKIKNHKITTFNPFVLMAS